MKKFYLQLLWLLIPVVAVSQTKVYSVIGSSTAAGMGATVPDSNWVNRVTHYYQSLGLTVVPHNLAVGGRNCYQGMPNGYIPPPGRDYPQSNENITMALSFSPEVVIISYPTNNYNFYSISEIMTSLQAMKDAANAQGKTCYITTSQPRQDPMFPDLTARTILKVIRDSIMNRFTNHAIDFFTGIANPDYTINTDYTYGDGIHLNDAGHRLLFERVKAKNIFNVLVPIALTEFSAEALKKSVYTSWKVMDETPGVQYSLQRSKDGIHFENVFSTTSHASRWSNSYKYIDQPGSTGVYFYRIVVDANGPKISSATRMVILNDQFSIKNLIVSPSRLRMTLGSDEHQEIDIRMLNTLGATVQQSKKTLNPGFTDIDLSIQALAPGVYWFEVRGNNIRHVSEFLKK